MTLNRFLWLLAYAALSALAFVVEKAKDYAAEQVAPGPKPDEPAP